MLRSDRGLLVERAYGIEWIPYRPSFQSPEGGGVMRSVSPSRFVLSLSLTLVSATFVLTPTAQGQVHPKTQLSCYYCAEIYPPTLDPPSPGDYECESGFVSGSAVACRQWVEDGHWQCQVYGGNCGSFEEQSLSESAVTLEEAGFEFAASSVEFGSGVQSSVWVLRSCDGGEVSAYVQIPGDRFVPIAGDAEHPL